MSDGSWRRLLVSANEPARCVISMCWWGSSAYCAPPEKTSAGFNCWSISVRYAFDVLVSSTTSCK